MENKVRILVIDDEADLRENLQYILKMKGYEVELAEDGVQGLHKLNTFTPNLIILDLNMPNMGGIEFYQKICDGDVPRYPVFVLTARANMEQFFRDFNVDGFMAKPFEITDLLGEVSAIINKKINPAPALQKAGGYTKIHIVDNDQSFASRLGSALLTRGYTVHLSRTGTDAIENISKDVPEVALVQLRLPDIAGDVVVGRLKRMSKTSDIKCVLYAKDIAEQQIVRNNIVTKAGIDKFIVVTSEGQLVDAVASL